ncbi:MAG: hypothetical protein M3498_10020 [Deinococcota bacterium]|jgi:uncharacterized protein YfbU (UPF0304 family)|nr:hypothetical protein [Deinococcota bacterium]
MADTLETPDNHQYLTDAEGNRTHVLLTLEEYEELLHSLLDLQDAEIVRQRRAEPEGYVSLEEMKARLGL